MAKKQHIDFMGAVRRILNQAPLIHPETGDWRQLKQRLSEEGLIRYRIRPAWWYALSVAGIAGIGLATFHWVSQQEARHSLGPDNQELAGEHVQIEVDSKFREQLSNPRGISSSPLLNNGRPPHAEPDRDNPELRHNIQASKSNNPVLKGRRQGVEPNGMEIKPAEQSFSEALGSHWPQRKMDTENSLPVSPETSGFIEYGEDLNNQDSNGFKNNERENSFIDSEEADPVIGSQKSLDSSGAKSGPALGKWRIGLYFSPENNWYKVQGNASALNGNSGSLRGKEGIFQYSAGITAGYKINNRIGLEYLLIYAKGRPIHFESYSNNYSQDSSHGVRYINYRYHVKPNYLRGSLSLVYHQPIGAFRAVAHSGLGWNAYLPVQENGGIFERDIEEPNRSRTEKLWLSPLSIGSECQLGIGMEYEFTREMGISLGGMYRQDLTPLFKHSSYNGIPVTHYQRGLGIYFKAYQNF